MRTTAVHCKGKNTNHATARNARNFVVFCQRQKKGKNNITSTDSNAYSLSTRLQQMNGQQINDGKPITE